MNVSLRLNIHLRQREGEKTDRQRERESKREGTKAKETADHSMDFASFSLGARLKSLCIFFDPLPHAIYNRTSLRTAALFRATPLTPIAPPVIFSNRSLITLTPISGGPRDVIYYIYSRRDARRRRQVRRAPTPERLTHTDLFTAKVPVAHPFPQLGSPVLEQVRLGKLGALAVTETALSAGRGDHVHRVKIDFQPLARLHRDLLLRTPGTAVALLLQSARINICSGITDLYCPSAACLSPRDRQRAEKERERGAGEERGHENLSLSFAFSLSPSLAGGGK